MSETQQTKATPSPDPLLECMEQLLSLYSIEADLKGIVASIPHEDRGMLTEENLFAIARRLGFRAEIKKADLKYFDKSDMPVMLFCKDGNARLHLPKRTHQGKIFKPGAGLIEESLEDLKDVFEGRAFVLYPKKSTSYVETAHMHYGHMSDWFWKPIWSYWQQYSEILLCTFFINLFVLAVPLYTMNIYDRVVVNFVESTLYVLTTGIIIALIFDFLFKIIRSYLLERVAVNVGIKYEFDLMERLLNLRSTDLPLSVGEKANIFRELQNLRDFYAAKLAPTLVDMPFFLLFLGVIYMISPPLMAVPVTGAVIIIIVNLLAQAFISRSTKKFFTSIQMKSAILIETLAGGNTIRMFNAIGDRLFKWQLSSAQAAEQTRRNHFLLDATSSFALLITSLVTVFVLFLGVYEIRDGALTVGGLIACTILSGRAIGPIVGMAGIIARLKQSRDVLITIDSIFQLQDDTELISKTSAKGPFDGKISLRGLGFQYPGQTRPALNKISMTIEAGERVGLIGRSGAGKSTLAKLIAGHLKPQQGEILLDNFSYENISPAEISRIIGVVPQDSFYFTGTLRDNILLGESLSDTALLDRAIEVSGLDLAMEQIGCGLDMDVMENGANLSGGHKQAVALARVLVRDPQIVIFDEPTTGMDSVLEARIKTALDDYLTSKTFIMVTHRTTLLNLVDRLVLLDGGKIVADGARDDIMKKFTG